MGGELPFAGGRLPRLRPVWYYSPTLHSGAMPLTAALLPIVVHGLGSPLHFSGLLRWLGAYRLQAGDLHQLTNLQVCLGVEPVDQRGVGRGPRVPAAGGEVFQPLPFARG